MKIWNEKEVIKKQFDSFKKVEKRKYLKKSDHIDVLENTLEYKKLEIERLII